MANILGNIMRALQPGRAQEADMAYQKQQEESQTNQQELQIKQQDVQINQQELQIKQAQERMNALSAAMGTAKEFGGLEVPEGHQAFVSTLTQLGHKEMADQYATLKAGKKPADIPYGLTDEEYATWNKAKFSPDNLKSNKPTALDELTQLADIQKKNQTSLDAPINGNIARVINDKIAAITGSPAIAAITGSPAIPSTTGEPAKKVTLADMLSESSQDQQRTGFGWFGDDTISQGTVRDKVHDAIANQITLGVDPETAKMQVATEYNDLKAQEKKNTFKIYPDVDVTKMLADEDTRKEAISTGKAIVVDTGDGVKTTPDTLSSIGFTSTQDQEDFIKLEQEFTALDQTNNLRAIAKDPTDYTKIKKILDAIRTKKLSATDAAKMLKEILGG